MKIRYIGLILLLAVLSLASGTMAQSNTATMVLSFANPGTIQEGRTFDVQLKCADISNGSAAFSCFADLSYPSSLLSVESIAYDADYPNYRQGSTVTPGVIDRLGAVSGVNQPGGPLVATVTFRALAEGNGSLTLAADERVFSEVTLYDLDTDQRTTTAYGSLAIAVEPSDCQPQTIGIYRDSNFRWYLRFDNSAGFADHTFGYGLPSDQSVIGDWDGDGDDTVGIYRNNIFYLVNTNGATQADIVVPFGVAGDIPVAGDWDGDGIDTIGVYRPSTAAWALRNSNTSGAPDLNFGYGLANEIPLVGDWDGDGDDTVGIYRVSDRKVFLRNSNDSGNADNVFIYGNPAEDIPLVGDWNGDCVDTIGVYRSGLARWYLRNTNDAGTADITFNYGLANEKPVAGTWPAGDASPVITAGFITDDSVMASAEVDAPPADDTADEPPAVEAVSLPASASSEAMDATAGWAFADGVWTVSGAETSALTWTQSVDLSGASNPALSFTSSLSANSATAAVQVSAAGGDWATVTVVSADDAAPSVDLSAYAGQVVNVRFVWIGGDDAADAWSVSGVSMAEAVTVVEPPVEPTEDVEPPMLPTVEPSFEVIEPDMDGIAPRNPIEPGE